MKNGAVKERIEEKPEMTPVKRDMHPYPFHFLQRDMNKLFEDFTRGVEIWRPHFAEPLLGEYHVKVDLKDNEKEFVLSAEVPGVDQKDIEITITPDYLMIKGEKKEEKEENEKGYYRSERSYGCFQRVLPLPCKVEKDHVTATFKNGILKVVMPKCMESMKEVKKVEIKSESTSKKSEPQHN